MIKNYSWIDNPTEANVAVYDPDILNECLMHLKYQNEKLPKFCVNSASVDANGNANLLSNTGNIVKFNCGNSLLPIMTSNSQSGWTLTGSHQVVSSSNDFYKSFDNSNLDFCSLQHTPSEESPAFLTLEKSTSFSFDYLYLKFKTTTNPGDIKSFRILDINDNTLYSYANFGDYLDKDEFLIPIYNFNSTKLKLLITSNVNNVTYTIFPSIIKLLDKTQVLTLTNTKGDVGNLINISDFTIPSIASKTYTIFVGTDGSVEAFNTTLGKSTVLPTTPTVDQIHLLTCIEPLQVKKYNGTIWEEYTKVPVGYAKTNSSGTISEIGTFAYNQNGYNLNINSSTFTQSLAASGWVKLPNGFILQWGSFSIVSGGTISTNFPIAFPSLCKVYISPIGSYIAQVMAQNIITGKTLTGFTTVCGQPISVTMDWLAIGY